LLCSSLFVLCVLRLYAPFAPIAALRLLLRLMHMAMGQAQQCRKRTRMNSKRTTRKSMFRKQNKQTDKKFERTEGTVHWNERTKGNGELRAMKIRTDTR
jgi:hypothetical protein